MGTQLRAPVSSSILSYRDVLGVPGKPLIGPPWWWETPVSQMILHLIVVVFLVWLTTKECLFLAWFCVHFEEATEPKWNFFSDPLRETCASRYNEAQLRAPLKHLGTISLLSTVFEGPMGRPWLCSMRRRSASLSDSCTPKRLKILHTELGPIWTEHEQLGCDWWCAEHLLEEIAGDNATLQFHTLFYIYLFAFSFSLYGCWSSLHLLL